MEIDLKLVFFLLKIPCLLKVSLSEYLAVWVLGLLYYLEFSIFMKSWILNPGRLLWRTSSRNHFDKFSASHLVELNYISWVFPHFSFSYIATINMPACKRLTSLLITASDLLLWAWETDNLIHLMKQDKWPKRALLQKEQQNWVRTLHYVYFDYLEGVKILPLNLYSILFLLYGLFRPMAITLAAYQNHWRYSDLFGLGSGWASVIFKSSPSDCNHIQPLI